MAVISPFQEREEEEDKEESEIIFIAHHHRTFSFLHHPLLQSLYMAETASIATPKKISSFRLHSPTLHSLRLRRIFDLFDKNGDGIITIHDLSQALSVLGVETNFCELELTVKSHIRPGNEGLEFEDFVSFHPSLDNAFFGELLVEEYETVEKEETDSDKQEEGDLSDAFKVFDEHGDGYISAHKLKVVLRKLGLPKAKEIDRVQQMIVAVDSNHDGLVDFLEFRDMMRRNVLVHTS